MNTRDKLIRLAIRNISQEQSAWERISILREAAEWVTDIDMAEEMKVTAMCLEKAEETQMRLSQFYT